MPPRGPPPPGHGATSSSGHRGYGSSQAHADPDDGAYYDYASRPPPTSPPPQAYASYGHADSSDYPAFAPSGSAAGHRSHDSPTYATPPPQSKGAAYLAASPSYPNPFQEGPSGRAPAQGAAATLTPGQFVPASTSMTPTYAASGNGHHGYDSSYSHDPYVPTGMPSAYDVAPRPSESYNHGVPGSASYPDGSYAHEETHELDGDVPLLPQQGNYAYAPASSFDVNGRHMGAMNGDGMYDDEAAFKQESEGGYMPGGFDPNLMEGNVRFGRIPQRVPRRYKTLKRVELFHGNLVLDCPTAPALLDKLNDRESREMTHARYSAVTCDPDDFLDEHYTLRQVLFDPPRRTELMICLTMYNEDEKLFCRTLHGVLTNIAFLCSRSRSRTWGADAWKRVVVVIVADGRMKCNPRVLSVLAALGVYQEGVAKNVVNGKEVTMHLYEYTTQLSVDPSLKFRGREKGVMPTQIIFALKEKNAKKINSHRWCFNAFGRVLQPNVCVLLDVGTMPRPKSIYHLWKAFDINSNVAGACGEIVALKGKMWSHLLNPLVAAQNFEYKMSNILDKPLESVFGYISVLPGAFSAYRYIALQNDTKGNGPLCSYFKGEKLHSGESKNSSMYEANMYLAEDRILCWELTSKRDAAWILHYVKSAQAVTDVPDTVPELISQRRRWLNGSFFAGLHSIVKFGYIYRSSHTFGRKLALHVEMLYQVVTLLFTWFGIANYFLAFRILTKALGEIVPQLEIPNLILEYVYLALIVFIFLLSMGNRPAGAKTGYTFSMVLFAVLTIYMTFCAIFLAVKNIESATAEGGTSALLTNYTFVAVVISVAATYGVYLIASVLFLEPWHMFTSVIQYFLLAPSFVSVFGVYSMCNVHDVSWGTKGSDKIQTDLGVVGGKDGQVEITLPTEAKDIDEAYHDAVHVLSTKAPKQERRIDPDQKQQDYYATIRTNVVLIWVLTNAALAITILSIGNTRVEIVYMAVILYSVAVLSAFRLCGALVYLIKRLFAGQ